MEASFYGQEVTAKHEPQRIIGAGRKGVANIVSAGAADKVVTRFGEHGIQYDPRIESEFNKLTGIEEIISAGDEGHGSISFERILKLRPDVVYRSALGDGDLSIDDLEANGISTVMSPSSCTYTFADATSSFADLDAIPVHVHELGALLNTVEKADTNASTMGTDLVEARAEGKKLPELTVASLYYWDPSEDSLTCNANSMVQGIFDTAHLKNVTVPTYDTAFSGAIPPEAIVKSNPDILIVTTGEGGITLEDSLARLEKTPGMTEAAASKNKRIIEPPSGAAYPAVEAIDTARGLVRTLTGQ